MKKYIIIATILVGMLSMTSCEEFLDVNKDPNNPIEVSPNLILPVAQVYTARYVQGAANGAAARSLNHLGNMLMYNWSESYGFSWYDEEFKYLVSTTFYASLFNNAYSDALKQYTAIEEVSDVYKSYKAIAKIMKAYHFQILVDLYGDVPYSEALQRGVNPTPKYDKAEDIYSDLMIQLDNAIKMIEQAEVDPLAEFPGNDDAMFGGDMTSWKQFANTLKVRILNRAADAKGSAYVTAELAKIATEGSGYITANVGVNPGYVAEVGKQNPIWDFLGWTVTETVQLNNDATCATQWILNYLTSTNDPRLDRLYELPETGHLGVDQGTNPTSTAYGAKFVSNIGPGILKAATQDAIIFTLAESYFNQAELALNGGDAESLYNAGVEASFVTLGLTTANAATYLSQEFSNINYAVSTNKLQAIITQKWIAMNGITAEQSWFDYNRTGFPANLPTSIMATTDRPVRLFYPASETTGNTANVPTQLNAFTAKIFWAN